MRKRLELVKEILFTPTRIVLSIIWGIITNLPSVISFVGGIIHQDLTPYTKVFMESGFFDYLAKTWWIFLLVGWFALIAEGIFQKTRNYLGDRIKTQNIFLAADCDTRDKNIIAFITVKNHENVDLDDCYASMTVTVRIDGKWVDKTLDYNPNYSYLSWPLFTKSEKKMVRSGMDGRIDIATYIPNSFAFSFEDGNKPTPPFTDWRYYLEIKVNGYLNKIPIETIEWHGFVRYQAETKDMSAEIISAFGSELKNEVILGKEKPVDIPYRVAIRLYLEPGELEER